MDDVICVVSVTVDGEPVAEEQARFDARILRDPTILTDVPDVTLTHLWTMLKPQIARKIRESAGVK